MVKGDDGFNGDGLDAEGRNGDGLDAEGRNGEGLDAEGRNGEGPDDDGFYDELSRLNNELVNIQRTLAKKNAELERLGKLKNQFLGMAAHDLRKPVGAVMAYSGFIADEAGEDLSQEHRRFLKIISEAAKRMRRLIDEFLDVTLIESGEFELRPTPVSLDQLMDDVLDLLSPTLERREAVVQTTVPRDLPPLSLDKGKFEQVFLNLVSNSVEHGGEGVHVTIQAENRARGVRVSVTDNGPGVPPERLSTLFQLSGHRRSRKASGERSIGLGLAIVKKIVEAHGGAIHASSPPGEGAAFVIDLPEGLLLES